MTEQVEEPPIEPVVMQGGGDGEIIKRVPWVLKRRHAAGKMSQNNPGPVLKVLRQPYLLSFFFLLGKNVL